MNHLVMILVNKLCVFTDNFDGDQVKTPIQVNLK